MVGSHTGPNTVGVCYIVPASAIRASTTNLWPVAEHNFTDELSNRALDTVDSVVAAVNDKAIRPAIVAARAVVFGVIIAVVALAVLVLLSVGFIRLTTVYLFHDKVWVSYLVLGAIFCAGGAFAYSKRGVAPHSDA